MFVLLIRSSVYRCKYIDVNLFLCIYRNSSFDTDDQKEEQRNFGKIQREARKGMYLCLYYDK
jgi:hypothetical protein